MAKRTKRDKPLFIVEKKTIDKTMFLKKGGLIRVSVHGLKDDVWYRLRVPYCTSTEDTTVLKAAKQALNDVDIDIDQQQDRINDIKKELKLNQKHLKELGKISQELKEYIE